MRRKTRFRALTAAQLTALNPILGLREPVYEHDTNKMKIGDGSTRWNDLEYFGGEEVDLSGYYTQAQVDAILDYFYSSIEIDSIISGLGFPVNLNGIIAVSITGSDDTGQRGNLAKPFKTIQAAFDAATNDGDTIIVSPGSYYESVYTVKGFWVNIYYMSGAKHYRNPSITNKPLIEYGYTAGGLRVFGFGEFYNTSGICLGYTTGSTHGTKVYGANSIISTSTYALSYVTDIENVRLIQSTASYAINGNGLNVLKNIEMITGVHGISSNNGGFTIKNCNIDVTIHGIVNTATNGTLRIEDCSIKTPNGKSIMTKTSSTYIKGCRLLSNLYNNISFEGTHVYNAQSLITDCVFITPSGRCFVENINSASAVPLAINNVICSSIIPITLGTAPFQIDGITNNVYQDSNFTYTF